MGWARGWGQVGWAGLGWAVWLPLPCAHAPRHPFTAASALCVRTAPHRTLVLDEQTPWKDVTGGTLDIETALDHFITDSGVPPRWVWSSLV